MSSLDAQSLKQETNMEELSQLFWMTTELGQTFWLQVQSFTVIYEQNFWMIELAIEQVDEPSWRHNLKDKTVYEAPQNHNSTATGCGGSFRRVEYFRDCAFRRRLRI